MLRAFAFTCRITHLRAQFAQFVTVNSLLWETGGTLEDTVISCFSGITWLTRSGDSRPPAQIRKEDQATHRQQRPSLLGLLAKIERKGEHSFTQRKFLSHHGKGEDHQSSLCQQGTV